MTARKSFGPFHVRRYRPNETFYAIGTSPDKPFWKATSLMLAITGNSKTWALRIFGHKIF